MTFGPPRKPLAERFWPKVARADVGCWEWLAFRGPAGYGQIGSGGAGANSQPLLAHRVAYELTVGRIPAGLVIDHLCANRGCVRPDHLEAVTQRENTMRGHTITAANAAKTHCPQGHEFTEENTYLNKRERSVHRMCRTCLRERDVAQRPTRRRK